MKPHYVDPVEYGPVYGVRLIDSLQVTGMMRQACPSRSDLEQVRKVNERTAAAYEVLLNTYLEQLDELSKLRNGT